MKPAKRKSGLHAVTVRITHSYITADLVARAIIDSTYTTGEALTCKEIEKALRRSLEFSGRDRLDWLQEKIYLRDWAERLPWATEQIRRHWPQWADEVTDE